MRKLSHYRRQKLARSRRTGLVSLCMTFESLILAVVEDDSNDDD